MNEAEQSVKIVLEPGALNSKSNLAPIRLDLGGRSFPNETWSDFLVSVLLNWAESLVAYLGPVPSAPTQQDVHQLSFIDGPWTILLQAYDASSGQLTIQAAQKTPGSHIDPLVSYRPVVSERISAYELCSELRRAAECTLLVCEEKALAKRNLDVEALAETMPSLAALQAALPR